MLMSVTIEKNQKFFFDTGTRLIRAESLFGLQANGTGSKFTYPINYKDRREKNGYLETAEAPAAIEAQMVAAYASGGSITLNVYPDNDPTSTPVSTIYDVTSIQWGAPAGASDTYLSILEGAFKVNTVLVAHTIAQIIALA